MMSIVVEKIGYSMSLRDPQNEALSYLDSISSHCDYKNDSLQDVLSIATEYCEGKHQIRIDKELEFPSFCFDMATGIGKTRLMGASIFYLHKTKGYKHFFILAPGNTIYDKLRKESNPNHPKYMFKGLESEMGRPKVYDGDNYISYPIIHEQLSLEFEKSSEIQLFIFNIGKIFNSKTDVAFRFHKYQETLGASFADVLSRFDDLVICMDEAHRYYAPASMRAINYLKPILGLEFTATPKSFKNVIYSYDLSKGAGKYLKIPVVMGRTNTFGYSDSDLEEMKIRDGLLLHENRKKIVKQFCFDHPELQPVKPIVLIACKDTDHAKKIKGLIDDDKFYDGKYKGKVIEIHSQLKGEESEENINKLLSIEKTENPIEIVLHVYKLKEGWDVNNLFTIIPLNAAKSDILALQTIGRGLRLPFGFITGNEEIDTLDIVAHDHYRELVNEIKNNPVFKYRDLDDNSVEPTKIIEIEPAVTNDQLSLFDDLFKIVGINSFEQVNNEKTQNELLNAYDKAFVEPQKKKKDDTLNYTYSLFDLINEDSSGDEIVNKPSDNKETVSNNQNIASFTNASERTSVERDNLINLIKIYANKAISIPKISVQPSTNIILNKFVVKMNIKNFNLEASKIERFDVINKQMLSAVDAQMLEVDSPFNTIACMLFDCNELSEIDYNEDADYIIDVVNQYLNQIPGTEDEKKKIVRRYGKLIIDDIVEQIRNNMTKKTEYAYNIQKDLIMFGSTLKTIKSDGGTQSFRKAFEDKNNIKKYVFTGYKKSYYSGNSFDSDSKRFFSIVLEDDENVLKWVKPPVDKLGIYWKPGKQYTPDFIIETKNMKYMVDIISNIDLANNDIKLKTIEANKWCVYASKIDVDKKTWEHQLILDNSIEIGSKLEKIISYSLRVKEE